MAIDIARIQEFHGHMCPGLAIGIRVAEQALLEMGERPGDEEVVAIVETDNCAVDAIQFITGCTFGKGNLILLNYGKNAFRFIRRKDGKAIRIRVKADNKSLDAQEQQIMQAIRMGMATVEERQQGEEIRQKRIQYILNASLSELLEVQSIRPDIPPRARIFDSSPCQRCGEPTMESCLRLLEGKAYCPECYQALLNG